MSLFGLEYEKLMLHVFKFLCMKDVKLQYEKQHEILTLKLH